MPWSDPREENWIGWDTTNDRESDHRIQIRNGNSPGVDVRNNGGASNYPPAAQIEPVVGIIAGANPPASLEQSAAVQCGTRRDWAEYLRADAIGLLSRARCGHAEWSTMPRLWDSYIAAPNDEPLDSRDGMPLKDDALLTTGTTLNYKTVFLQRLANPLLPWNPLPGRTGYQANLEVNPYITVDWIPIDLTVFNGEDDGKATNPNNVPPDQFDPDDRDPQRRRSPFRDPRARCLAGDLRIRSICGEHSPPNRSARPRPIRPISSSAASCSTHSASSTGTSAPFRRPLRAWRSADPLPVAYLERPALCQPIRADASPRQFPGPAPA